MLQSLLRRVPSKECLMSLVFRGNGLATHREILAVRCSSKFFLVSTVLIFMKRVTCDRYEARRDGG